MTERDSAVRPITGIAEIAGLWRRSLIRWPDGRSDTTTAVWWMQTPSLFADLRQPVNRPSFAGVRCLRDLDRTHIDWLARQEGFAGEILWDGLHAEWRREFDFQPKSAFADAGKLWFEGDVMVEEGRDLPYREHWHREAPAPQPCAGIALRDSASGQAGMLVRAGDLFMYARARLSGLPARANLSQLIREAPAMADRQDLIDCEISLGSVGAEGWRIERSSLPFKEGHLLAPQRQRADPVLRTIDLGRDGQGIERRWDIVRLDHDTNCPRGGKA